MRMPSSRTWVKVHATLTVCWAVLILPSILLWRDSVPWLVGMSVWANVAGSAASWQAARGDLNSPTTEQLARLERKVDGLRERIARR